MSEASPERFKGTALARFLVIFLAFSHSLLEISYLITFVTSPRKLGVAMAPGEIAFTLIFLDPIDAAKNLVLASRLALAKPITL